MSNMETFIVVVYGNPGSGKGTQAQQIADHFGLEHFNTGGVIERVVHNPSKQTDPIIQREAKLFDDGILCTPEWVTEIVKEAIIDLHRQNKGIVFSASPRTLYEAQELFPLLENLYGKEKIFVLKIEIRPETAIFRNSNRRVCEKCSQPIVFTPENAKLENCPFCGGKLVTRTLDDPEVIKVRLKEYQERTVPIFNYLKERDYQITEIDGEPAPDEVTKNIFDKLPK